MWPVRRDATGGRGTMQRPYASPGGTSDDDDLQLMVNLVPVIRIDFPCFLSRLPSHRKNRNRSVSETTIRFI